MIIDREALRAWSRLLRYGEPVSVRGFQRLMGYSSPGKAQRILRRLERYGLVSRNESGEYVVVKNTPPYLSAYMVLHGHVFPRSLLIAVFTTVTALTYILLANPPPHIIALLLILVAPNWIDTIHYLRIYREIMSSE